MTKTYQSHPIHIGHLAMGGDAPVCIQSMTNTNTNHIEASVEQCIRMIQKGAQLVRLTTQGNREVKSLETIRNRLRHFLHLVLLLVLLPPLHHY